MTRRLGMAGGLVALAMSLATVSTVAAQQPAPDNSKLAKASASPKLRAAFEAYLEETRGQVERLEEVFANLDEKVRGKHCDGIAGIIEEGKSVMEEDFDEATMDACLIASGQRAEHYEMAAYGTLVAWARAMGHDDEADLLQKTLNEEKAADKKLSALADGGHQ